MDTDKHRIEDTRKRKPRRHRDTEKSRLITNFTRSYQPSAISGQQKEELKAEC